jgi:hypothetical protein
MAKPKPIKWEHDTEGAHGDYYWAEVTDADGMPVVELFVTKGDNLTGSAWSWSVRFIGDNSRIWSMEFFGKLVDAQKSVVNELPVILADPRIC